MLKSASERHLNHQHNNARREHKSAIMIDPIVRVRARDKRRNVRTEGKLFKKRTRFKSARENKQGGKSKKQSKRGTTSITLTRAPLALLILVIVGSLHAHANYQPSAAAAAAAATAAEPVGQFLQSPDRFPSATLGKFGAIAGLRFDARNRSAWSVAAFLGVPYAAPPTGPLRFMPPGAARPAANQSGAQKRRRCHQLRPANLSSAAQMPSGASASSRFFGEFGRECVRLADWLLSSSSSSQLSQVRQAEDCLNLNIFVPHYQSTEDAGKARRTRRAELIAVETNHRNRGRNRARLIRPANQAGQQQSELQHAQEPEGQATTRRRALGLVKRSAVNSSEANPLASGVAPQSPGLQDHHETDSPCYLEPLRVPGAHLAATDSHLDKETRWQSFHHHKQQSTQQISKRRLPVIVVFHSAPAKTNSLAWHLSLVQRAQSIVITFNYRIGLLGYLPYIDPEDQTGGASENGGAHHTTQTLRLNHALWDQIGLLFWIKQNVAAFQGDPNNVTLLSSDNKAAVQIQVLTMSPLAKGLFKRIILNHNQKDDEPTRGDHLKHLFELATRSRELKRKLVSEMGLIVKHLEEEEQFLNATKIEANFSSGDRRVFEFLKMANLSQLARVERALAKISFSRPGSATIKLNDLISEPHLDDKMLFPYFAQLARMNQSLVSHGDAEYPSPGGAASTSGSFWSFLQDNIDLASTSNARPLTSTKMEVDYCLYLQQLHRGLFDRGATENNMTLDELNQLDPYKLIPRLSEHQLMTLAASTTSQLLLHSSTAIDNNSNTSSQFDINTMRWTRNRTANAIDFYHLRHAHLLQQLLVRKLESSAAASNASSSITLHQNIRRDNPSTKSAITSDERPALESNLGSSEKNQDEEGEEEDDNLLDRLRQQQSLQHEQSSARTKRGALDQLGILGQQLIELMSSYDLLISVSYDRNDRHQYEEKSSLGLVETLLRVNNNRQIDLQLLAYLHLASLHYISTIKMSSSYLDDLCDISSQYSSDSEDTRQASTSETISHDIRSSYVVLRPYSTPIDDATSMPILLTDEELQEYTHSGNLASINRQRMYAYDTLNYRLNIGLESESFPGNEANELTGIHLELVPYLKHTLALQSNGTHPADLISCLGELESVIVGASNHSSANHSLVLTRLNDESYCLTNVANKLRNQLRSGAARELEPITGRYLSISGAQHQQYHNMLKTKSTLKQQQLALINGLTTRNLVNQSEGLYLDQLSQADQINNDQQMDASTSSNSSRIYPYDLNEASKHGVSVKVANPTSNSSLGGFFAKTYKDAVGQALGIVVGTGALIFLLNLIIVLIIALKSRRRIRGGTQHVQDSSSSSSSGVIDSANQQQQQQLKTLNGLLMADHQVMMNGSLLLTAALDGGANQTKQLTSSFRDQQPRSSLSSNSQRVNKSIKFDLSGVEDQTRTVVNEEGNQQQQQQQQRGIMKQPMVTTTSDEDGDLPPSDQYSMPTGTCHHHSHENPYASNRDRTVLSPLDMLDDSLDLNGFDLNEMLVSDEYSTSQPQQQQQQQQQPRQATTFTQVQQNKCQHHQRQMQSIGSGSLTSPFASQSTPSDSAASCGQQIYTINHRNNNSHQGHHMIIANTGGAHQHQHQHQHHQQQQQQLFYPLVAAPAVGHNTAAILNSPSSSNTLSSAPTPILLAGTNEHHMSSSAGQQMVNLIYPCDNLLMLQQLQSGKPSGNGTLSQNNQLLVHLSTDQQHYLLDSQQR